MIIPTEDFTNVTLASKDYEDLDDHDDHGDHDDCDDHDDHDDHVQTFYELDTVLFSWHNIQASLYFNLDPKEKLWLPQSDLRAAGPQKFVYCFPLLFIYLPFETFASYRFNSFLAQFLGRLLPRPWPNVE